MRNLTPQQAAFRSARETVNAQNAKAIKLQEQKQRLTKALSDNEAYLNSPEWLEQEAKAKNAEEQVILFQKIYGMSEQQAQGNVYGLDEEKSSEQTPETLKAKLETKLLAQIPSIYQEKAKGWMNIKKNKVDEEEYLQALKRRNNVFKNREQRQERLGHPLTLSESGLSESDNRVVVQQNALWMIGKRRDKVKLPSDMEFTSERDILDVLGAFSGKKYSSIQEAYKGGDPIDWGFVAPLLGLTQASQWNDGAFLGVGVSGSHMYELCISEAQVRLNSRAYVNYDSERLVRSKNS